MKTPILRQMALLLACLLIAPAWAAETEVDKALAAVAQGQYQAAQLQLERLVNRHPERADLRAAYAQCLLLNGDAEKAAGEIAPALARKPRNLDYLMLGIDIDIARQNWSGADALIQRARTIKKHPPALYARQAQVLEAMGRKADADAAIEHYQTLIQPQLETQTPPQQ